MFGLYPTLVKDLARTDSPLVFSFYRDLCGVPLLFLCAFITERKIMIPGPKMLLVWCGVVYYNIRLNLWLGRELGVPEIVMASPH